MEQITIDYNDTTNIVFKLNNQIYMHYVKRFNVLNVDYPNIWLKFESENKLNNQEIKECIIKAVEDNTNLKGFVINWTTFTME